MEGRSVKASDLKAGDLVIVCDHLFEVAAASKLQSATHIALNSPTLPPKFESTQKTKVSVDDTGVIEYSPNVSVGEDICWINASKVTKKLPFKIGDDVLYAGSDYKWKVTDIHNEWSCVYLDNNRLLIDYMALDPLPKVVEKDLIDPQSVTVIQGTADLQESPGVTDSSEREVYGLVAEPRLPRVQSKDKPVDTTINPTMEPPVRKVMLHDLIRLDGRVAEVVATSWNKIANERQIGIRGSDADTSQRFNIFPPDPSHLKESCFSTSIDLTKPISWCWEREVEEVLQFKIGDQVLNNTLGETRVIAGYRTGKSFCPDREIIVIPTKGNELKYKVTKDDTLHPTNGVRYDTVRDVSEYIYVADEYKDMGFGYSSLKELTFIESDPLSSAKTLKYLDELKLSVRLVDDLIISLESRPEIISEKSSEEKSTREKLLLEANKLSASILKRCEALEEKINTNNFRAIKTLEEITKEIAKEEKSSEERIRFNKEKIRESFYDPIILTPPFEVKYSSWELSAPKSSLIETTKNDIGSAAWRMAAHQLTKLIKVILMKMVADDGGFNKKAEKETIRKLLSSSIGMIVIEGVAGQLLSLLPEKFNNVSIERLAEELRVQSLTSLGNSMIDTITETITAQPKSIRIADVSSIEEQYEEEEEVLMEEPLRLMV